MDDRYYLAVGSEQKGPFTFSQLQTMWRSGSITADTLYCQQGFDEWVGISSLAELLDPQPTSASRPISPAQHPALAQPESDKRILSAFLLCLFFGYFGAHAFYAGRMRQGLLFLAFPVTAFLSFFMFFILSKLRFGGLFGGLFSMPFLFALALAPIFAVIFALGDLIRIIAGSYKDGQGRKITKWT